MARYDRVPTDEEDKLNGPQQPPQLPQLQLQQEAPVPSPSSPSFLRDSSLFLPNLANAIRARASSLVSDISFHSDHSNSSRSGYSPETPATLLPTRSSSNSSNSPTSPPSYPSYFRDTQSLNRNNNQSDHESNGNNGSGNSGGNGGSRSQRIISRHSVHVRLLRLIWLVALLVGEHGTYWAMVQRCAWPENSSWDMNDEALRKRYRIAIVADPQLTDWMSYHQSGLLLALVEIYTDIYMKRSFHRMHASLRPDAVLFLGDLNDGGRESFGEVFDKNSNRFFEKVFETKSTAWNQQPIIMDAIDSAAPKEPPPKGGDAVNMNITGRYHQLVDVPLDANEREAIRSSGKSVRLYVAGNHDVGFGNTLVRPSMARFKRIFGSVNYEIEVGNHSLVVLDTLALSSDVRDIREESQQFLTQMENEKPTLPRILFTHVPLFRRDTTYCGDSRETEQLIIDRKGFQYQNMVNANLSRQILRGIQPDMVFSGDDHDWCEIAHSLDGTLTPEITLPTFSFAQGIQQPGFVMLSLYNPEHKVRNAFPMVPINSGLPISTEEGMGSVARPYEDTTFAYEECMLPNQMLIYMCYIALLVFSLNCILIQRYRWMVRGKRHLEQLPILVRWTNFSSCPSDSEAAPQGSTTATAISSSQQKQQPNMQRDRYNDEHGDYGSPAYFENAVEDRKQKKNVWPLLSSIYWKMSGWDLWNVLRYAVPFYAFLFVASII